MTHKVLIDTDPGIDDAMAIVYAHLDPKIELVGLTSVFGNVTAEIGTRNALALSELTGAGVPVAHGAEKPLVQEPHEVSWHVHGREGFGDLPPATPSQMPVDEKAYEFICRMINENPGEIILCPVGPFTNIALALQHDPSIVEKVKSVTVMGGSLYAGGNVTDHAEANIWHDPHAADIVFAADWPISMIGLDVTQQVICTPAEFAKFPAKAPKLGRFLNDATQFYFEFHKKKVGVMGCQMHDPSAIISISYPEFFEFEDATLSVVPDGLNVGETVKSEDEKRSAVRVAVKCNEEKIRQTFLSAIDET